MMMSTKVSKSVLFAAAVLATSFVHGVKAEACSGCTTCWTEEDGCCSKMWCGLGDSCKSCGSGAGDAVAGAEQHSQQCACELCAAGTGIVVLCGVLIGFIVCQFTGKNKSGSSSVKGGAPSPSPNGAPQKSGSSNTMMIVAVVVGVIVIIGAAYCFLVKDEDEDEEEELIAGSVYPHAVM